MQKIKCLHVLVFIFWFSLNVNQLYSQVNSIQDSSITHKLDETVSRLMKEGNIPGLSLVIVEDGKETIKSYGYSNLKNSELITPNTLFELGDCSMVFTAMAVLKLEKEKLLHLDANISDYLPWFKANYRNKKQEITLRQLLHHTSGISSNAHIKISVSNNDKALLETIKNISNTNLVSIPGEKHVYSLSNYNILALIIEQVTETSFETYIQNNIFNELNFKYTSVGIPINDSLLSNGHKISFYQPRVYDAPRFTGNNAALYVMSNAKDISRWIQLNLANESSGLDTIIKYVQRRDETVPLHEMLSYGMGWNVSLKGDQEIFHSGLTPNFSSYISFNSGENIGVAVLSNSNSPFTKLIGDEIMKSAVGKSGLQSIEENNKDKIFSSLSIGLLVYISIVLLYGLWILVGLIKKRRVYKRVGLKVLKNLFRLLLISLPFALGVYVLPNYLGFGNWDTMYIWNPSSLETLVYLIISSFSISCVIYCVSVFFPSKNEYYQKVPEIVLMSIISGLADVVIISMITSSLNPGTDFKLKIFYYALIIFIYLIGRRVVQHHLITISFGLVYDLRVKLIDKIFKTTYQDFEKIDRGRFYSVLNQDVNAIGGLANVFTNFCISIITILGGFIYLATISIWTTLILLAVISVLAFIYHLVVQSTDVYYEEARDEGNIFMRLLHGMVNGFKELNLHGKSKNKYKNDIDITADKFKNRIIKADVRFLNASLVGESMLLFLLGVIAFGFPIINPDVNFYTIASFVIVLLYILNPIEGVLNSLPQFMRIKVAWKRIKKFTNDIPISTFIKESNISVEEVKNLTLSQISFEYEKGEDAQESFGIGPIDMEVNKGEIVFIIGANGSGKSTLAKVLLGLYKSNTGHIMINDKKIESNELGEYFSVVFNPSYLFKKLYNVNEDEYEIEEVNELLKTLKLEEKVNIKGNEYNTIDLSSGQMKRLGLLQCYIENSPIFLFDEWAADQDPYYRNFFYRELLPKMKKSGKIVIAITHDDNYFDVADRVMQMKNGKLEQYSYQNAKTKALY